MNNFARDIARAPRLSDEERREIMDRLDQMDADNPAKNRRSMPRVAFRQDIAVRIFHPGGSMTASYVITRNLSVGGISFLYHGFLHKNTKVEIVLPRRLGGEDVIGGTIQHCQLINRTFHLMGVRFNAKIFPKLYLDPTEWDELGESTAVEPGQLTGTIVHVDPQEMDRLLLQHYLKGTQIKLLSVPTVDAAVAEIAKQPVDGVLTELAMDGMTISQMIGGYRDAGFGGPIGVLTAESTPAKIKSAQEAGSAAVLGKPYEASKLLSLLGSWLQAGASSAELLYSTLGEQEAMLPLIRQYVQRVRDLMRELHRQMQGGSVESVRTICQTLRGTGAGFGFGRLSEVAKDAVASLDETASIKSSLASLQQLEQTGRRIACK